MEVLILPHSLFSSSICRENKFATYFEERYFFPHSLMKSNIVINKDRFRILAVSGQFGWHRHSLALFASAPYAWHVWCSIGHHASFSIWILCLPPSLSSLLLFPLICQCDGCLVPLAWGLMAGRCKFTTHGGLAVPKVEAPGHLRHSTSPK